LEHKKGTIMVNLSAIRLSGPTYMLTLSSSASSALLVTPSTNDQSNYVTLLNTGTNPCAITMAPDSANLVDPAIATTGNSGAFVLPGSMNYPLTIASPKGPFYLKGISSGSSTLFITPTQAD
jgi:hypothetical protein